ncbi:MAG TPA: DUF1097 domain-containing protein [Gammaproteobacteria bacterium]|nr:DUF1097 domain-containing protein [Gammaproteobacteria bacterium]
MPALLALATSVGVLAIVATWLFAELLAGLYGQIWIAFVAWGAHYHCGGKLKGTQDTIVCMSFGAVIGMLAIYLAGYLGAIGQFAAPLAVGIGATVIVLSSSIRFLAAIPASVYGFASIAGLWLLGGTGLFGPGATVGNALLPTILSIVVGAAFGIVSENLANALTKK